MKNIVLFQPSYGDFDSMRTMPSLPLGLLHCASIVDKYFQVKIIDERITHNWEGLLINYITEDTICVGVTAITGYAIKGGLKFSKYIKDNYDIPVVWGGIHATILPKPTLGNKNINIIVEGEGEVTFYELVRALEEESSLNDVAGIWYKKDGNLVKTSNRDFIDLNEMPDVPYHLVDINNYLPAYRDMSSICFQSSRGCPLKCGYCYNNIVNRGKWRSLSAEKTLERIKTLVSKYSNIESIYFIDDNLFVDLNRGEKIIKGLKELNIYWFSQGVDIVSLGRMSDSYIKLIQESNCLKLTVGVESGSERIRKLMNKAGTPQDILSIADRFKKYDIIFYCDFMVGMPTETKEDIRKTVNLLLKMQKINKNFRNSAFYVYVPYPGTSMYELISDEDYKMPETLKEWANYEWNGLVSSKKNKDLRAMHFISLFIDQKAKDYNAPYIVRVLVAIYRPFARFRMKKLYFKFIFEKWFYDIIKSIWYKTKF